jgi:hypothetical protein
MRQVLLLVVVGVLASCHGECLTSAQCPAGEVCMRVHPSPTDDSQVCVVQCPAWGIDNTVCGGAMCSCPDSPAGSRCQVVGSSQVGGTYYCGR